VEGDNKVKRSKKTSELRFTDNSMLQMMMVVGKRLSCWGKIVQEGYFLSIFCDKGASFLTECGAIRSRVSARCV
jgi:hypothetical protein